ncbi:MAG: hypothetical protein ACFCUR_03140 [Rhodomicrobiaceae bacterium]
MSRPLNWVRDRPLKVSSAIAGTSVGAYSGAGIGIAGAFGAVSGIVPCAVIGGIVCAALAPNKFSAFANRIKIDKDTFAKKA